MTREVPEWIGRTPDTPAPPRVLWGLHDLQETIMQASIPEPMSGCWLWERACQSRGYGQITVNGKVMLAHRASFEAFYDVDLDRGLKVCHRCDNPICVNPEHLFVGTQSDNMKDCANKGRIRTPHRAGAAHPMARISEEAVASIRNDPRSYRVIAAAFGVSKSTVHQIKTGKSWGHL